MKKIKFFVVIILFFMSFLSLFTSYDCVAKGITKGLYLSANVIIPTLFPLLCVTAFLSNSGVINSVSIRLENICKKFFNSCGYFLPVFLMSLVSGYPVGASLAQTLYKNDRVSITQRNNIAAVSCSAGPSFLLLAVGVGILNSFKSGLVLLITHILSSIIIGLIVPRFWEYEVFSSKKQNKIVLGDALVLSVNSSSKSIISICAYTILFSAIVNVISKYLRNTIFYLPIVATLEVTSSVYALSSENVSLPVLSAVLGFGGFSCIFQIMSILRPMGPDLINIVFIRTFHAIISFLNCSIILKFFKISEPVFKSLPTAAVVSSGNYLFSVTLIILLIVLLAFFNKVLKNEKISYF